MTTPIVDLKRRGLMFVLSSPSGAGKTSLSKRLLAQNEDLSLSVSATTRAPRPGEVDGVDYVFVSQEEMREQLRQDHFLEYATVFGNLYGTPKDPVEKALTAGKDVLFDIDWQGAQQLHRTAGADLVRVFILPPSLEVLKMRLTHRCQDSEQVIASRMAKASDEISHWAEYDYVLINDCFAATLENLQSILAAERLRLNRQLEMASFVQGLLGKGLV